MDKFVIIYNDNFFVYFKTAEEHARQLEAVLCEPNMVPTCVLDPKFIRTFGF